MTGVSIIIPIYATDVVHDDYLRECLSSCEDQSDDIIIWDDGSRYPYNDMIYAAACDYNARYHLAAHEGKSFARNHAVTLARHDLILPVDADDWLTDNAIDAMLSAWESNGGIPVYSDIFEVHAGNVHETKTLLGFDCDAITKKCVASIFVLHSKEQWEAVGGWDESCNLYEDWIYNAKLMWMFCGEKIAQPLLYYRQHDLQSTVVGTEGSRHDAWLSARLEIEKYTEGASDMACCGKRRDSTKGPTNSISAAAAAKGDHIRRPSTSAASTQAVNLSTSVDMSGMGDPGPGNVWALYVGGRGMGPHDRRGMASRKKYLRIKYGDHVAPKAVDVISRDDFESGAANCGFVALESTAPPALVKPAGEPPKILTVAPKKAVSVVRVPIESEDLTSNITTVKSMTVSEFKRWLDVTQLSLEQLIALRDAEAAGANRVGALRLLKHQIAMASS